MGGPHNKDNGIVVSPSFGRLPHISGWLAESEGKEQKMETATLRNQMENQVETKIIQGVYEDI